MSEKIPNPSNETQEINLNPEKTREQKERMGASAEQEEIGFQMILTMGRIRELLGDVDFIDLQNTDLWDQFLEQKNALETVEYKLRRLKEKAGS